MYSHATLLYLFVETPLHAGSGRGLGAVDLPIQRERSTGYPMVQATGIKGKLRAEATSKADQEKVLAIFGPDAEAMKDEKKQHAGAVSPGDARLLLLPVRSLAGVFAWATSENALARFQRDVKAASGQDLGWEVTSPGVNVALVAPKSDALGGGKVVLEEFSYEPQESAIVQTIGEWLAKNALPMGAEYKYWRDKLPRSLVILPEDDFRDFALYATEVVTRIRLDNDTKTVAEHMLWTEESLPTDTLLYAPLFASDTRNKSGNGSKMTGEQVLNFVSGLGLTRVQLGGDETVGRGLVALRFGEVRRV